MREVEEGGEEERAKSLNAPQCWRFTSRFCPENQHAPKFTEAFTGAAFVRVAVKLSKMESARETKLEKIPMELPEIVFGSRCEIRAWAKPMASLQKDAGCLKDSITGV